MKKHIRHNWKRARTEIVQSKVFELAIIIMGDTFEDMVEEIAQKYNKIQILEKKRLPSSKVIKEMNKLGMKKILSKKK